MTPEEEEVRKPPQPAGRDTPLFPPPSRRTRWLILAAAAVAAALAFWRCG